MLSKTDLVSSPYSTMWPCTCRAVSRSFAAMSMTARGTERDDSHCKRGERGDSELPFQSGSTASAGPLQHGTHRLKGYQWSDVLMLAKSLIAMGKCLRLRRTAHRLCSVCGRRNCPTAPRIFLRVSTALGSMCNTPESAVDHHVIVKALEFIRVIARFHSSFATKQPEASAAMPKYRAARQSIITCGK